MKHTTTILTLMGGIALGSALTIYCAHKSGHIKSGDIHKKIIEQVEELKSCLMEHIESVKCNCDKGQASATVPNAEG